MNHLDRRLSEPNVDEEGPYHVRISKLLIHPIKSCKGTSVAESVYTPEGLAYDRTFAIIDARTHVAVTARDVHRMVLVNPVVNSNSEMPYSGTLDVSFPSDSDYQAFRIPLNPGETLLDTWPMVDNVKVWRSINDGYVVQSLDDEAAFGPDTPSETLSRFLGRSVLLVKKGFRKRLLEPTTAFPNLQGTAAFQDGYPLLVASDASLADIAKRVRSAATSEDSETNSTPWEIFSLDKDLWREKEFAIERFRPNIVIAGDDLVPFDEERWEEIAVGKNNSKILLVSICYRCPVPNIDPDTGVIDKSVPSQVLNKYRRTSLKNPNSSCFGINACSSDSGVYRVGDQIQVIKRVPGGGLLPIPPPKSS